MRLPHVAQTQSGTGYNAATATVWHNLQKIHLTAARSLSDLHLVRIKPLLASYSGIDDEHLQAVIMCCGHTFNVQRMSTAVAVTSHSVTICCPEPSSYAVADSVSLRLQLLDMPLPTNPAPVPTTRRNVFNIGPMISYHAATINLFNNSNSRSF